MSCEAHARLTCHALLSKQAATPKPEEDELSKALRRARESTDHSAVRTLPLALALP